MKRSMGFFIIFVCLAALAQEQTETTTTAASEELSTEEKRIIRIDSSGGTEEGDLRFGPINYTHPDPEGIKAAVSNLTIFAQQATLRGPEGEDISLTDAEGRRSASFTNGVRVTRGRLEAMGPDLFYSEETGLGTLSGGADISVAPKEEGDDPVFITADEAEFDVDTDVSISKGNVMLENGNQSAEADTIEYEEERTLGVLSCNDRQCTVTRTDEDGSILTITADEIRANTDAETLYAKGNAVVVDGDITTKGDEVFFDDVAQLAEIIGNPAESFDESEGATLSGARLQQDIEFDVVEPMNEAQASTFSADEFLLTREKTE